MGGDGAIGRSRGETLRSSRVSSAAGVVSLLREGHDAVEVVVPLAKSLAVMEV